MENEINLFNDIFMQENEYENNSTYYTILLEQWKTANEMANEISNKRANMNNYFSSLFSILLSASVAALSIKKVGWWVMLAVGVIGILLCLIWTQSIKSYKELNGAKYMVINSIEDRLPANVMKYEWEGILAKKKKYVPLSKGESSMVKLFAVSFCVITILALTVILINLLS